MTSQPHIAERLSDRIFGATLLVTAAALFWSTFNPDWFSLADQDEARTVLVPRVLLVAMMALSVLLIARSLGPKDRSAGFTETVC